jgi:RNA polymerase sigma-70 factor (ECF subfamily)
MDMLQPATAPPTPAAATDASLVTRTAAGDQTAFEALMRRHNGRLFRAARAILKDDAEAEDAVQDAYLDAYRHMRDFRGDSQVGTWLVRIAVNHALMRLRKQKRNSVVVSFDQPEAGDSGDIVDQLADDRNEPPGDTMIRGEIRQLLERRIDELPISYRTVFILREVEEMSVEETSEALGIPPATVRTRLFRARALLRQALVRDVDLVTGDVFGFAGARCDRIVASVLARISSQAPPDGC